MSETSANSNMEVFCKTPTADLILANIKSTMTRRSIGVIVGAPGIGKTTALTAFIESNSDAYYCVMSPAQGSLTSVLSCICRSLHLYVQDSASKLHDELCRWARRGEKLLIIDEAQHMNDLCLEELRCIRDETGLALVFCGNDNLAIRLNGRHFAQLTSRIGPRIVLPNTTLEDVSTFIKHRGVRETKVITYLKNYALKTTGLRQLSELLILARDFAGKDNIALDHVKQAENFLGEMS